MKYRNQKMFLPINLQFHAAGSDGDNSGDVVEDTDNVETPDGDVNNEPDLQTFDDILKDKKYQSEFDKRVAKAIETSKAKWQDDYKTKIEEAKNEAEKLAKMNAEQKQQYEMDKRLKDLEDRERQVAQKELETEAKSLLTEKGLPQELSALLDYSDADNCNKSIATVEAAFKAAVEAAVENKIKGSAPLKKAKGQSYTQEELDNMSDEEYYAYQKKG